MPSSGILLVDKPRQMTSHDLVNICRRVFHTKKVGHTGTLDPDATGVMIICVGQATRLNEYLTTDDKHYRATLRFGQETDTQDITGDVTVQCPLPVIGEAEFCDLLQKYIGKQMQTPPVYSAIKKDGKPLYQYAREGLEVPEIPAREIEIYDLNCVSYLQQEAVVDVYCSKGTYIRTLCQDIARASGSCGCMSALVRTAVGKVSLKQCVSVETLKKSTDPYALLLPMHEVLDFPLFKVENETQRQDLMNGKRIQLPQGAMLENTDEWVQAIFDNALLAVGSVEKNCFVPKKVFHG